jgi:hypothetical protein
MSAHCSGSRPNRAIGDGGVRPAHRAAHTLSAYFRERKIGKNDSAAFPRATGSRSSGPRPRRKAAGRAE